MYTQYSFSNSKGWHKAATNAGTSLIRLREATFDHRLRPGDLIRMEQTFYAVAYFGGWIRLTAEQLERWTVSAATDRKAWVRIWSRETPVESRVY
jgi:hypothetical protein